MSQHSADEARRRFLVGAITLAAAGLLPAVAAEARADATTDAGTQDEWRSVLMSMFPHPGLEPALYTPAAAALAAAAAGDAGVRQLLAAGRSTLAAGAGGSWNDASEAQRTAALAAAVGTPLFALLRQTVVFTFYNDHAVWARFGYEGDAWSFGGWLGRGVDTIRWLPDPTPGNRDDH